MQHDDRERDDAAGAPHDENAEQAAQDAQGAAPEGEAQNEEEFENAPSMSRPGDAPDETPPPSGSESPAAKCRRDAAVRRPRTATARG